MTTADVLGGVSRWYVSEADNLAWLESLPAGCASLCLTSPPYEDARTYGIGFKLKGQAWVDWMIPRVVAMCRAVEGLVCINMAGKVRDHSYSPVVEWLVADLTRQHGLVCGPAPYCFFRYGIPGSGSTHYHRRDWEPIYCFCRPEVLPLAWSANTAEGHPPKWGPGGEMSNRGTNGKRVNQSGMTGKISSHTDGSVSKDQGQWRPSHVVGPNGRKKRPSKTQHGPGGDVVAAEGSYAPPVLANPGNVVRERYDSLEVMKLFEDSLTTGIEPGDVIHCLVGGGQMGSKAAHENEAPFPERLAEFFVRSYAAPGTIVLDPFSGSGTVGAVALAEGRRYLGCDVRSCQVELSRKRIAAVTPTMFAG